MATNITSSRLEYIGAFKVVAGKQYSASEIASSFSGATAFIIKGKGSIVNGVREYIQVSINDTATISLEYNETIAYDATRSPAINYKFSQDCILLVIKELVAI